MRYEFAVISFALGSAGAPGSRAVGRANLREDLRGDPADDGEGHGWYWSSTRGWQGDSTSALRRESQGDVKR